MMKRTISYSAEEVMNWRLHGLTLLEELTDMAAHDLRDKHPALREYVWQGDVEITGSKRKPFKVTIEFFKE